MIYDVGFHGHRELLVEGGGYVASDECDLIPDILQVLDASVAEVVDDDYLVVLSDKPLN